MARSACFIRLSSIIALLLVSATASAVQRSEALLPATTKGYISTDDVDEVRTKFNQTDLGALVADPLMQPFIADFKKQIGAKLEKAGKKLGLKWADMEGVYSGEVALALIQPNPKDKMSHAQVLLVDITGKRKEADAMLAKVDANQAAQGAKKTKHAVGGVEMIMYEQKLKAGEKDPERNFYFIHEEQLVASDHYQTALEIANRMNGKATTKTLDSVEAFKYSMQRNQEAVGQGHHHVRWFVEPFGYVEASRAAEGGRRKRGTDYLKILQGQGFPAIQGLGGYVLFSTGDEEILHRTYVYAPPVKRKAGDPNKDKYDLAMRMLDFPNSPDAKHLDPQPWVLSDVASYLTFNWKMKEAFAYSETLVDAIAGDKGVFDEIWLSMKTDPNGPMIDIHKELIDQLGERATLLSDVTVPVTIKSERLLVLVEVKRPDVVAKALEKAFKEDPAAKKRVFRGQTIWELTQEEETTAEPELMIEGAGFVSTEDATAVAAQEDDKAVVIPNMALAVLKDHLVVSTHVDYIEEFISRGDDPNNLAKTRDFQRVQQALLRLGSEKDSFRYYTRTEEAYRATYELIQQNKLPEAETLLARILNAMLSEQEGEVRKREIDGSKLPPYKDVMKYFGPGGLYVQSEDNGWWAVGCLLKRLPPQQGEKPVNPATAGSGEGGEAAAETTPVKTPAPEAGEPAVEVAEKPKE